MASRLPVIILTVFTILLLIEMCNSLPYHRDINADCRNVPHVIVVHSATGVIKNCHECPTCPLGHGLNIPCYGQNVTESQNIECVPCVSGMNYSTGETNQCQPCLPWKCKVGKHVVGKCENDGDKRSCKSCELKHWYYNNTQMTCLPCACENMTTEIKGICKEIGFNSDACEADGPKMTPSTTPKASGSFENGGEIWNTKHTIIVVSLIVIIVLVLYVYCVRSRAKELKLEHPQLSICSKDWFCKIFFFKKTTSSRLPLTVEFSQNRNSTERFIRQFSCPVTQNEMYAVINTPHAAPSGDDENKELLNQECERQKLKFSEMNVEICRKILQKLEDPDLVNTGMGYTSLAGLMNFSDEKVKEFKASGNPCRSMLETWSSLDAKENNVLELKRMVEELKIGVIVNLLDEELEKAKEKCGCRNCGV